ncbi:short-chain dehydrogenase [Verticillium dahliae]
MPATRLTYDHLPLHGKVYAVTGGASGIGLATAKLLSTRGAAVCIADIDAEAMKAAEAHFTPLQVPFMVSKVDVSRRSEVDSWIDSIIREHGRLDGAANVAGVIGKVHGTTAVTDMEDGEWDRIIAVNLTGTMYCMRAQLRSIADKGSIVNISSIHGLKGFSKHSAYDASKHAVIGLTKAAALENGDREIRVNSVAPGSVYTPLMQKEWDHSGRAKDAPFDEPTAFRRLGTVEETANVICFLLGPDNYGYSCNYDRQIKKRGRVPRNETAPRSHSNCESSANETSYPDQHQASSPAAESEPPSASFDQRRQVAEPQQNLAVPETHAHVELDTANGGYLPQQAISPPYAMYATEGYAAGLRHTNHPRLGDAVVSEPSDGHPSPANLNPLHDAHASTKPHPQQQRARASFSTIVRPHGFGPFSPIPSDGSQGGGQQRGSQYGVSTADCRYRCLDPLLPYLGDVLPASVACDLFDVYLVDPGSSLFRCASPYILTRIFRKKSLLHPTNPRPMSPALLATILWCCAQTADISLLLVPGSRSRVTNALYELATFLITDRDPDRWRRIHGGLRIENEQVPEQYPYNSNLPSTTESNEPAGAIDDVLTFILLCIGVSGGDFKSDCLKWWSKAARLALSLRLNRLDEDSSLSGLTSPPRKHKGQLLLAALEAEEEKRRVFWLLYSLDRHLALSFNRVLQIPDSSCEVYAPLAENMWETLDEVLLLGPPARTIGPLSTISGSSFFEYFLPLMVILGDIIEVHHSKHHPRLGSLDNSLAVSVIGNMISECEESLARLAHEADVRHSAYGNSDTPMLISNLVTGLPDNSHPAPPPPSRSHDTHDDRSDVRLVVAYSTHILHVMHVLLHGKWDAISMLDNEDDWITTPRFAECASHAIAASEAVSDILKFDPELTFMPYLFGIYLLHGSFILLLFADRMPQLGPNQSVEQACETIIRAHEVCVVTLSTEFQVPEFPTSGTVHVV